MVATLNIILPLISQGVISSLGFGISLVIDVVMSLVYQALTVLGCGGMLTGGAVGGGAIATWIVGAIMSLMSLAFGVFGFSMGDLIQMLPPALGMLMDLVSSVVAFMMGLL